MGNFSGLKYSSVGMSLSGVSSISALAAKRRKAFCPVIAFLFLLFVSTGYITAQNILDPIHLANSIKTGSTEQKRDALFAIRKAASAEASMIALPALNDKDEMVRATAAASVVFLPTDEAVRVLLPLLNDRSPFVRRETAYALEKVGSNAAASRLVELFQKDKDREVRAAAAIALATSGNVSSVSALAAFLQKNPVEDDEFLRRSAARSIGGIAQMMLTGDRAIVTPQNMLSAKYKNIPDADNMEFIAEHPQFATATHILASVLNNRSESEDTRREAAFALGAIGGRSSISVLEASQNSPDPYLAEISKEALMKIR